MDNKIAHLQMIQDTIARLENNVFQTRLWAMVMLGTVWGVLLTQKSEHLIAAVCATSAFLLMLWGLGSYYQRYVDIYRAKYESALKNTEGDRMPPVLPPSDAEKKKAPSVLKEMLSLPQSLFFLLLVIINICVFFGSM